MTETIAILIMIGCIIYIPYTIISFNKRDKIAEQEINDLIKQYNDLAKKQ